MEAQVFQISKIICVLVSSCDIAQLRTNRQTNRTINASDNLIL